MLNSQTGTSGNTTSSVLLQKECISFGLEPWVQLEDRTAASPALIQDSQSEGNLQLSQTLQNNQTMQNCLSLFTFLAL